MIVSVLTSILFLFFLAATIIAGRIGRAGVGKVPIVYRSVFVQFFLNVCSLIFFALFIYLCFSDWHLLFFLIVTALFTETWIFVPVLERSLARLSLHAKHLEKDSIKDVNAKMRSPAFLKEMHDFEKKIRDDYKKMKDGDVNLS
jgi:hypothetical protein